MDVVGPPFALHHDMTLAINVYYRYLTVVGFSYECKSVVAISSIVMQFVEYITTYSCNKINTIITISENVSQTQLL